MHSPKGVQFFTHTGKHIANLTVLTLNAYNAPIVFLFRCVNGGRLERRFLKATYKGKDKKVLKQMR